MKNGGFIMETVKSRIHLARKALRNDNKKLNSSS